jgi:hypothetical protein
MRAAILPALLLGAAMSNLNAQDRPRLPLVVLDPILAICRLAPDAELPEWAMRPGPFLTVSRTSEELSIVVRQAEVPADLKCERDYRALRVRGPLPLNLVGILASMAGPLAEAGLSIFAISTYDTDYLLVKGAALDSAVAVLKRAGHDVTFDQVANERNSPVVQHAGGTFEVKLAPQPGYSDSVGRMSLDKQFQGDLTGTSIGEMLAVMSGVQGSAGYVAMERVTGSLKGRTGSFALQHNGLMNRGEPSLTVTVVPDSGTDQLTGLAGTMKIIIEGKKHSYEFDYTLPPGQ